MPEVTADEFRRRERPTGPHKPVGYHEGIGAQDLKSKFNLRESTTPPPQAYTRSHDPYEVALPGEILEPEQGALFELGEHTAAPAGPKLPTILKGIDFETVKSRTDLIREVTPRLPLNEHQLPLYILRPDFLDVKALLESVSPPTPAIGPRPPSSLLVLGPLYEEKSSVTPDDLLRASMVELEYDQGFPTFQGGDVFWGRLPFESSEAYAAFTLYLELPGARSLRDSSFVHVLTAHLWEWFHCNYWRLRALAYDLFRVAHHSRVRAQRIMGMENQHYAAGERIFQRLAAHLGEKLSDEALGELDPDKMMRMMGEAAKLQRTALGLNANGGGSDDLRRETVEIALRQGQRAAPQDSEERIDEMDIFSDPTALEAAQELIIRVQRRG